MVVGFLSPDLREIRYATLVMRAAIITRRRLVGPGSTSPFGFLRRLHTTTFRPFHVIIRTTVGLKQGSPMVLSLLEPNLDLKGLLNSSRVKVLSRSVREERQCLLC